MSTLLVDQVKPLLQRLLTMAESHDERLARLEAAQSRLGNQLARLGEQLTRQGDQLLRMEEAQTQVVAGLNGTVAAIQAAPAIQNGSRLSSAIDPAVSGRLGEQIARLNEQITRVREQFGRVTEQLGRVEQFMQGPDREEVTRLITEQAKRLERLQEAVDNAAGTLDTTSKAIEVQGEVQTKVLALTEQVLEAASRPVQATESAAEPEAEPQDGAEAQADEELLYGDNGFEAEEEQPEPVDLASIQNEMAEMRGQLALLLARLVPEPRAASKPVAPRPVVKPAPKPVQTQAPVAAKGVRNGPVRNGR